MPVLRSFSSKKKDFCVSFGSEITFYWLIMIHFGDTFRIPGKTRWVSILILLNILSFAVTHVFSDPVPPNMLPGSADLFLMGGGVIPAEFGNPAALEAQNFQIGPTVYSLADIRPPSYVTIFWSLFLHANFLHLLVNLFFLYQLGRNVEAYMGGLRFMLFYLSCGAAGMAVEIMFDLQSTVPIVGASGAISGLMGAYLLLFPNHDFRLTIGQYHKQYRDIVFPFKVIFLIWIVNQLFLLLPDPHSAQSVAVFAHLGGFVCGVLLARGRQDRRGGPRRNFRVVSHQDPGPFHGVD